MDIIIYVHKYTHGGCVIFKLEWAQFLSCYCHLRLISRHGEQFPCTSYSLNKQPSIQTVPPAPPLLSIVRHMITSWKFHTRTLLFGQLGILAHGLNNQVHPRNQVVSRLLNSHTYNYYL